MLIKFHIIGLNQDEFSILSLYLDAVGVEKMMDLIQVHLHNNGINKEDLEKLINVYKPYMEANYPNDPYRYLYAILSDSMIGISVIRQLEAHTKHQPDVYSYIFSYQSHKYIHPSPWLLYIIHSNPIADPSLQTIP